METNLHGRFRVGDKWHFVVGLTDENVVAYRTWPFRKYILNRDAWRLLNLLNTGMTVEDVLRLVPSERLYQVQARIIACLKRMIHLEMLIPHTAMLCDRPHLSSRRIAVNPSLARVFLEVTDDCNLRCIHCYGPFGLAEDSYHNELILSTTEICNLIDQAAELGVFEFDITGGEPLLRHDLPAILSHLTRKEIAINLFTNGVLLDDDWLRRLANYSLRAVILSLDGVTAHTHDLFRGVRGAFESTLWALRNLRQLGATIRINITASTLNRGEIPTLVKWLEREFDASFVVSGILPVGRGKGSRLNLPEQDLADLIFALRKTSFLRRRAVSNLRKTATMPLCGVGRRFLYVSARGDVSFCPTLSHRESMDFTVGNIRTRTLRSLWCDLSGKTPFSQMQCRDIDHCEYAAICGGGCRSRAYLQSGDINAPDSLMCKVLIRDKWEWKT